MLISEIGIRGFKSFGNNEQVVKLNTEKGELILLVGNNGNGKSVVDKTEIKIKFSIERTTRENGKYSKVMLTNKESIESFGNYIYEGFPEDSMGLKRKYEKFIGILKSYSLK